MLLFSIGIRKIGGVRWMHGYGLNRGIRGAQPGGSDRLCAKTPARCRDHGVKGSRQGGSAVQLRTLGVASSPWISSGEGARS